MTAYRVFLAVDVMATLRTLGKREQYAITRLLDELSQNPFRTGDYTEQDEIGRPIQVVIIGHSAMYFWADHAVKEVKIIELKSAGR